MLNHLLELIVQFLGQVEIVLVPWMHQRIEEIINRTVKLSILLARSSTRSEDLPKWRQI